MKRIVIRNRLIPLLLLCSLSAVGLYGQTSGQLHWDYPIELGEGKYFRVAAGEELVFLVWQETDETEEGGANYLSMAVSADGRIWRRFDRFAGPFPFSGRPVITFSMAVTDDDVCYIAVSDSPRTMRVYRTDLVGRAIEELERFSLPTTTVARRLFIGGDGGLRLFVIGDTRGLDDETDSAGASSQAILYAKSDDGVEWSDFEQLIGSTGADRQIRSLLQFPPDFLAAFGREYLVFPVFYTDEDDNLSNQLYLKVSDDDGESWSEARLITGFGDVSTGFTFGRLDNQAPRLAALEERVGLVWERGLGAANPQVFLLEIEPDGTVARQPEQVTQRSKSHRQPQLFRFEGRTYVLWFDDQVGTDHVKLASRQGPLWVETDLTQNARGRSSFGRIVEFEGEPFVFYEYAESERDTIVYLKPDESIRMPQLRSVDFTDGARYRRDSFEIAWQAPADSSGILGYAVSADRDPDGTPPLDPGIPGAARRTSVTLAEDGLWYIHLAAVDVAGNWSEPGTVSVFRDTTPPGPVTFEEPEIDDAGYLASNTYTLAWDPPEDDDVAGYSYSFQYLYALGQTARIQNVALRPPGGQVRTVDPSFSFRNIDNGLWALSVAPIDTVGNRGAEQVLFVQTNKYIPVTYITAVTSSQDQLGRIDLTVTGRGFAAGGLVSSILIDRDGRAPYDFVFELDSGLYRVSTDRIIEGSGISGVDEGDYLVGVVHPLRGIHFGQRTIAVAPSGQVKFGDFRSFRPTPLFILTDSKYAVPINLVIFVLIIAILAFLIIFSSRRIIAVSREARVYRQEIRALLTGELTDSERKARLKEMKRRGLGLRIKFALFTIIIVVSIVLIVAFPLGITMTGTQETLLARGLEEQTRVLLESLRTGAENFLPEAVQPNDIDGRIQLGRLPAQMSGVGAAEYVIITGQAQREQLDDGSEYQAPGFNYVWAENDPAILGKIDTGELVRGVSRLSDPVSERVSEIADRIDEEARAIVGDLPAQIQRLADEREMLFAKLQDIRAVVTQEEIARFQTLTDEEIPRLREQLFDALDELDTESDVFPEYTVERLSRENTDYIFYKPIVYAETGEDTYFRGLVRVGISTEDIIGQISRARRDIVFTTGIISLVAIGIGIIGALILSTIIIIPIKRLVAGVEIIRDTEDKEELKNHVIHVKTRDEIAALAETVNQMTQGLAAAAAANKDLILGKDTQKMFVPLEQDPSSGRKLTTASDINEQVEFFGYYEGAKGVSGDYFDFTRLDAKHYAIIKCDVAGKGVPASLIMVEVATIFLDYFRNWSFGEEGIHLDRLAYRINDLVEQRGFKGRFATLMLIILNIETGASYFCNAGDKYIHLYDGAERKSLQKELPQSPAAGVFPSDLVEMGTGFVQVPMVLKSGDALLLFTDGVEEDKRIFRDASYQPIVCAEPGLEEGETHDTHVAGEGSEELGIPRIHRIIDSVFGRGSFELHKHHNPDPTERFDFDFSSCEGTVEEAVLALAAVDKVFRLYQPPGVGRESRVRVDVKIDEFMKRHFKQYDRYFRDPVHDEQFPEYVYFPFLAEDDQYDDLTILGVRKL